MDGTLGGKDKKNKVRMGGLHFDCVMWYPYILFSIVYLFIYFFVKSPFN